MQPDHHQVRPRPLVGAVVVDDRQQDRHRPRRADQGDDPRAIADEQQHREEQSRRQSDPTEEPEVGQDELLGDPRERRQRRVAGDRLGVLVQTAAAVLAERRRHLPVQVGEPQQPGENPHPADHPARRLFVDVDGALAQGGRHGTSMASGATRAAPFRERFDVGHELLPTTASLARTGSVAIPCSPKNGSNEAISPIRHRRITTSVLARSPPS